MFRTSLVFLAGSLSGYVAVHGSNLKAQALSLLAHLKMPARAAASEKGPLTRAALLKLLATLGINAKTIEHPGNWHAGAPFPCQFLLRRSAVFFGACPELCRASPAFPPFSFQRPPPSRSTPSTSGRLERGR